MELFLAWVSGGQGDPQVVPSELLEVNMNNEENVEPGITDDKAGSADMVDDRKLIWSQDMKDFVLNKWK